MRCLIVLCAILAARLVSAITFPSSDSFLTTYVLGGVGSDAFVYNGEGTGECSGSASQT